jgi:hypothetical protein
MNVYSIIDVYLYEYKKIEEWRKEGTELLSITINVWMLDARFLVLLVKRLGLFFLRPYE